MASIVGLVSSVAVVLALWLGLSAPDTSPVDPGPGAGQDDGRGPGQDGRFRGDGGP